MLEKISSHKLNQQCSTLEQCLKEVSVILPLQFNKLGDNHYTIVPIRKEALFSVVDGETGESIPVILVQVNDQAPNYILSTNKPFSIKNLFYTDVIQISTRFYQSQTIRASALLSLTRPLKMNPDTTHLQEVVIEDYLVQGVETRLSDHQISANADDLGLLAGQTDSDVLGVLGNLPGIRTPDGKPGNINFRGGTFDQTLIYFDGIPIYHSGHFFGTISPYNPAIIENVEIYKGILPANFGGKLGGLINIKTSDEIPSSFGGSLSTNMIYSGLQFHTPIIKDKLSIQLSGRANTHISGFSPKLDTYTFLNLQGSKANPNPAGQENRVNYSIQFHDLNGKLLFRPNDNNLVSISFIKAYDEFSFDIPTPSNDGIEKEDIVMSNMGMNFSWSSQLSEKLKLKTGLTLSDLTASTHIFETDDNEIDRDEIQDNSITENRFTISAEYKPSSTLQFTVGYDFSDITTSLDRIELDRPDFHDTDETTIHNWYAIAQKSWNSKLIGSFGIRSTYHPLTEDFFVDPRISLSYILTDHFYIKGAVGRARQYVRQLFNDDFSDFKINDSFWFLLNEDEPVQKSNQFMVGGIFEKGHWLVDVEFYYKNMDDIAQHLNTPNEAEFGFATAKGMDLFIKRRWNHFQTWIGYSLSKVTDDFGDSQISYFDQTHNVNITGIFNFNRWKSSISWRLASGMPVIIPETDPNRPDELNIPYTDRFPLQHQLDASASYQFWKKDDHWRGAIGLSLVNIYDQNNIINIFQNNPSDREPYRVAIGFAPNISLTLSL